MTRQMVKFLVPMVGTYIITYHDDKKVNPFVISLRSGNKTHRVESYANYGSCLEHIRQQLIDTGDYYRESF